MTVSFVILCIWPPSVKKTHACAKRMTAACKWLSSSLQEQRTDALLLSKTDGKSKDIGKWRSPLFYGMMWKTVRSRARGLDVFINIQYCLFCMTDRKKRKGQKQRRGLHPSHLLASQKEEGLGQSWLMTSSQSLDSAHFSFWVHKLYFLSHTHTHILDDIASHTHDWAGKGWESRKSSSHISPFALLFETVFTKSCSSGYSATMDWATTLPWIGQVWHKSFLPCNLVMKEQQLAS